MPHRTTHRRQLASAPESSCLDPAKTQLKAASSYPDPVLRSRPLFNISKHLSRLHPNHLTKTPQKPSNNNISNPPLPCKDIHLQAKSMTVSADFDASKYSRVNSKHHRPPEGKEASKEKGSKNDRSKEKGSKNDSLSHSSEVEEAKGKKKKSLVVVESQEDVLKRMSVSLGGGGGGRRRSFCGSQVELSDFLASNGAKVVSVDMPPFMQIHAVDCARKTRDSLEKFTSKTLALTLKKEFDGVYGPAWHCIVGTSFGSFVTHSVGGFLYFSLDHKLYILLFKTTVQRAD